MARFVRFVQLTREGMMRVKEQPERVAKGRQYLESQMPRPRRRPARPTMMPKP